LLSPQVLQATGSFCIHQAQIFITLWKDNWQQQQKVIHTLCRHLWY